MTVFLMVFRPINFTKGPTIDTIVGSSILLRTLHSEACRFAGEAQKRWQTFLMFYVIGLHIDNIYSVTGMRNIIKPEGTMRVVSGVIRACVTLIYTTP